jgi:hypothetical protein
LENPARILFPKDDEDIDDERKLIEGDDDDDMSEFSGNENDTELNEDEKEEKLSCCKSLRLRLLMCMTCGHYKPKNHILPEKRERKNQ